MYNIKNAGIVPVTKKPQKQLVGDFHSRLAM